MRFYRCLVSFDDPIFEAGSYFSTQDLCFPEPRAVDPDYETNQRLFKDKVNIHFNRYYLEEAFAHCPQQ